MISVVNGFGVANKQYLRDKWDVSGFCGDIKVLQSGFVSDFDVVKEEIKAPPLTDSKRKSRSGFKERLAHQQSILKDYLSWCDAKNKWSELVSACDEKINKSNFSFIVNGISTISNVDKWNSVERAVKKLKKEHIKKLKQMGK